MREIFILKHINCILNKKVNFYFKYFPFLTYFINFTEIYRDAEKDEVFIPQYSIGIRMCKRIFKNTISYDLKVEQVYKYLRVDLPPINFN